MTLKDLWGNCSKKSGMPGVPTERHGQGLPWPITPQVSWHDVWFCTGFYLGQSSIGAVYGQVGSLVCLLVWAYYASLVFLFGAEFATVYAQSHGSRATRKWLTASGVGRK
jgi:uncharacterized BrkB/YihY/UPF0761 family membrane protein